MVNNEEQDRDYVGGYSDTSGTRYIWYDESVDELYFGEELRGGDPCVIGSFQSESPSDSQKAWIGIGSYSIGQVPAYSSSTYRGDDFCILDGNVVGPDVGACCFAESCVETIASSCDGDWQGAQTDCDDCGAVSCYGDVDGDGDVSISDIDALMGYWNDPGGSGDIDGSGVVDVHDLLGLLFHWGPCPG
jgi:hypothetical protein